MERINWLRCNVCAITTRDGQGEEFTYDTDGENNIVEIIDELRAPAVVHEAGCLADDPDGCHCAQEASA